MKDKLSNIIIVNDFAHINGGASQVALTSALELAKNGYAVTLISAVAPIMPQLKHNNLTVYCLQQYEIIKDPNRFRAIIQGLWNFRAARLAKKVLNNLSSQNTIIHLHGWTKGLSSSVIRVAAKGNFRIVCTMHDYFLACPNGGFFNYKQNTICTIKPLSVKCVCTNCDARSYSQKLWRCVRQIIQRYFGRMPSAIKHYISVSDFSSRILTPFLPDNAKTYCIHNPIEISQQDPVKVEQNENFVYVGRLTKEKGVIQFAQAAQQHDIHVQFIGDGCCKKEIANRYAKASILGWVAREKLIQLLQDARVLVLPSLWYETQGLVVLEAAALGIPAIVPDTSAAREFVVDGETGLWFKGGDVNDLAQKMKILLNDSVVQSMGQKAYSKYWAKPATLENHVDMLLECYLQVLQG